MDSHQQLDNEFILLRERVLFLGGEVDQAFARALLAIANRDLEVAYSVLEQDHVIDQIEVHLDRQCVELLAFRQPPARHLRFALTVLKLAPVLERIADQASSIARLAFALKDQPAYSVVPEISVMADCASSMLKAGLQAFAAADATAAREIIKRELEINKLYSHVFHTLVRLIVSKPAMATFHARQLLAARHIERIASYVRDICELTVYMATH